MFDHIPLTRPLSPLLDTILEPADLRALNERQLPQLCEELRGFLLYSVGQSGGHFGAGLGVVELTVALHYLYNTPEDRIVWDVGHQTYPHKILTGRKERMHTIRMTKGLAGFPKREESEYDTFGVGHSSTSISAALGMAIAAGLQGSERKSVAVIGDGAMTGGIAFEALNHAAHTRANLLVILNDNQMSISHNRGGLGTYFARIWSSKFYIAMRRGSKKVLSRVPSMWDFAKRIEEYMKGMVSPGILFEELGFNYIGPLDGHDLGPMLHAIENMRDLEGPQLLHIMTKKGKGFGPAEADPVGYHALNKIEPKPPVSDAVPVVNKPSLLKYQTVFGNWLCDMAAVDQRLVGITPAMSEGSGMVEFEQTYPERFHDVAIAEQHALTFAAGLACDGMKPVVAIYSTFLQRAYDQLIHDVALQNLDVTFGIDRAGLVGEDGPTHAGSFDLTFLRCVPNMVVMAPADENETRQMLYTGFMHPGPAAVRYPRGTGPGVAIEQKMQALTIGKGRMIREGSGIAFLNFGVLLPQVAKVADTLNASVADMRFVKPLDIDLVIALAGSHEILVTVEENCIAGGAGAAVNEALAAAGMLLPVLNLGLPDAFIEHGKRDAMLKEVGLDEAGIAAAVAAKFAQLRQAEPVEVGGQL
ncbi:MAG: 1-deoxy-D-xylulose-5-phosphate synthase [Halieaceae bacterium]|jgi:1-deoxy-D-xylulose-5-phosphate synthase